MVKLLLLISALLTSAVVRAETFILPPPDIDLIGEVRVSYARHDQTLLDIARDYGLGYTEIIQANPGVDRWLPGEGTPIVLPTRYILPDAPREGIVINLPEMRLYYYPRPTAGEVPKVITFPISIGRMDWKTPLGTTRIIAKQKDPAWYPPASIKAEHAAQGDILPDVVPGGPDNPLGSRAMRLGLPGYLIHGTNKPYGIGMMVTHGCIRMYPENIEELFEQVPIDTPVNIVDQPVKAGWLAGSLFLESHAPLEETNLPSHATVDEAFRVLAEKAGNDLPQFADNQLVETVVEQASGMAVPVSM